MTHQESHIGQEGSQGAYVVDALTPIEVAAALDGETLLIDIRDCVELEEEGSIPGAAHLPSDFIEARTADAHLDSLSPDRRMVIYSANTESSANAARSLRRRGFYRVAYLEGGFQAWKSEKREVEPRKCGSRHRGRT